MKHVKKQQTATSGGVDMKDARARRRAIERWENEGGSAEPTEELNESASKRVSKPATRGSRRSS